MPLLLLALATGVHSDEWSFKDFLAGDWDLERQSDSTHPHQPCPCLALAHIAAPRPPHRLMGRAIADGVVDHAHYSLQAVGNMLEGSYYEDVGGERRNEMVVKVLFDAPAAGQFQLAKVKPVFDESGDGTPPVPQPQPEPKTVFDFDFSAQSDSRFHLSTSSWLNKANMTVQFLTVDEDLFVFTKVRRHPNWRMRATFASAALLEGGGRPSRPPAARSRLACFRTSGRRTRVLHALAVMATHAQCPWARPQPPSPSPHHPPDALANRRL